MTLAIKIENLSKQYRLGMVGTGTVSHDLNRWWARLRGEDDPYAKLGQVNKRDQVTNSEYVWALKDINLEVEQGEVLGIIGANGAGKSTLLKILSRITSPTTGAIKAKGRIASLLEVGTGMNEEMTGRENVYLNGSILGMRRHEISRKLDDIIDFAGCRMYVDTPVKRYSSGMRVRLGFAVAAFLDPEILIVDEVLAVGDAEFQRRAIGKMQDISKGTGRTILFVSHNMGAVTQLCTRCAVVQTGKISDAGDVDGTVSRYIAGTCENTQGSATFEQTADKGVQILSAAVIQGGSIAGTVSNAQDIIVTFEVKIRRPIANIYATVSCTDAVDRMVFFTDIQDVIDSSKFPIGNVGDYKFEITIPRRLITAGSYSLNFGVATKADGIIDAKRNALRFEIEELASSRANRPGLIGLPLLWKASIQNEKGSGHQNVELGEMR
jgi:lipopolysaccharide transport system ATP-binding protein